ncbi:MAG: isoprenylcysteine carboxylmethyltransferase family protein [Candidatus Atribacteria bacterium]|nr:isoprenylcysteine carboxylmethyltransferase family protein [Candidatus Atribacteria bacterium]
MSLKLFQIVAIMLLLFFSIYISDFRNKKGMRPLLNSRILFILKIFYFIPIFIYLYVIFNLTQILPFSYFGLIFTFVGTLLVVKAKFDLGKYHTWAGQILFSTRVITGGIYSFIRHPIYTGIGVFMLGGVMIGIHNNPFSALETAVIIFFVILIQLFLIISAAKESIFLQDKFGKQFMEYKKQVHAFLPFRKYNPAEDFN